MKNKLIAAAMGFIILSGCAAQQTAQNNAQSNAENAQSASLTVQPADTQAVPSAPQLSAADQAAYNGALSLNDETMCDKISDATAKQDCKEAITAQKYSAEAAAKMDASICKKITNPDQEKACEINVEVAQKSRQSSQEQAAKTEKLYQDSNAIVQSGDYTKCKSLGDPNLINNCEYNILTNKAIQTGDVSYCSKISDQNSAKDCKNLIETSVLPARQ